MKNVAYKTISGNPNYPNGFIIEHFETDQDAVEGYVVVDKSIFSQLLANNVAMMRMHESNNGIQSAHPNLPPVPRKPDSAAEPADQVLMAKIKQDLENAQKASQPSPEDLALFQQFMEWKKSQNSGS
jgi:hypothetical protein